MPKGTLADTALRAAEEAREEDIKYRTRLLQKVIGSRWVPQFLDYDGDAISFSVGEEIFEVWRNDSVRWVDPDQKRIPVNNMADLGRAMLKHSGKE